MFADGCVQICMKMACYCFVCLFVVSVLLTAINLGQRPRSACVRACVGREEKKKSRVFPSVVCLVTEEQIYHNDVSLYTKHCKKSIMSVMHVKQNKRLCARTHTNPVLFIRLCKDYQ